MEGGGGSWRITVTSGLLKMNRGGGGGVSNVG